MNDDAVAILSALVDGESVSPDALADALLAPGARETLVDFARLRAELAADESRPSATFIASMHEVLGRRHGGGPAVGRALRGLAAAVFMALAVVGTISLPTWFEHRGADEPPRATRVLQFTPGVDWHEGDLR
jgi:hypothetical protein